MSSDDSLARALGSLACLLRWSGSVCTISEVDVLAAIAALPEAAPEALAAAASSVAAGRAKGTLSFPGLLSAAGYSEALRAYFTRIPSAATTAAIADVVSQGNGTCVSVSLPFLKSTQHAEWEVLLFLALANTPAAIPSLLAAAPSDLRLAAPERLASQLLRRCSIDDFRSAGAALSPLLTSSASSSSSPTPPTAWVSSSLPAPDSPDAALRSIYTSFPPESLLSTTICPLALVDADAPRAAAALTHLVTRCAIPVTARLLATAAAATPALIAAADARNTCISEIISAVGGANEVYSLFEKDGESTGGVTHGLAQAIQGSCVPLLQALIEGGETRAANANDGAKKVAAEDAIFPSALYSHFSRTLPPGCSPAAARDAPQCFAVAVGATLRHGGGRFLPAAAESDDAAASTTQALAQAQAQAQAALLAAAVAAGVPQLVKRLMGSSPVFQRVAVVSYGLACSAPLSSIAPLPAPPTATVGTGTAPAAAPAAAPAGMSTAHAAPSARAARAAAAAAEERVCVRAAAEDGEKVPSWVPSLPMSSPPSTPSTPSTTAATATTGPTVCGGVEAGCDDFFGTLTYPLPSRAATAAALMHALLPSLGPVRALVLIFSQLVAGAALSQGLCNVQGVRALLGLLPLPTLRAAAVGSGKTVCDVDDDGVEGTAVPVAVAEADAEGETPAEAPVARRPSRSTSSALALAHKLAAAAGLPSLAPQGPVGAGNGGSEVTLQVRAVLWMLLKLLPEGEEVDAAAVEAAVKMPKTTLIGIAVAAEAEAVATAALRQAAAAAAAEKR